MRRWVRALLLGVGIALLVWLIASIGVREILSTVADLGWPGTAVLVLYAAHQAVRGCALKASAVRTSRLRFSDALLVRLSGEGAQTLTAGGAVIGEPLKAWLLTRRGLSGTEGLAATLTEFLVYKFVSAVVMVMALVYLLASGRLPRVLAAAAWVMTIVGVVFLAVAAVAIAGRYYLIGALVRGVAALPIVRRRWRVDHGWVRTMEDLLLEILRERPWRFVLVVSLAILAHVVLVAEIWWLLALLDSPSPLFNGWLIDAATKPMGGVFFFVPGQVGTNEATLAAVFAALGLPPASGVVVALVRRARTAVVATVGLAGLWWFGLSSPATGGGTQGPPTAASLPGV